MMVNQTVVRRRQEDRELPPSDGELGRAVRVSWSKALPHRHNVLSNLR